MKNAVKTPVSMIFIVLMIGIIAFVFFRSPKVEQTSEIRTSSSLGINPEPLDMSEEDFYADPLNETEVQPAVSEE